jgi:FtsH-binding integral membrane protein
MRLMLIATLEMAGPAVATIASWGDAFSTGILIVMLGLMAAFVVHDLWTRRRVHLATVFGLVFYLGVNLAFQSSGVGPAIVADRLAHL